MFKKNEGRWVKGEEDERWWLKFNLSDFQPPRTIVLY